MSCKDRSQRYKAKKVARKQRKFDISKPVSVGIGRNSEEEWTKLVEVVPDRSKQDDALSGVGKGCDKLDSGVKRARNRGDQREG